MARKKTARVRVNIKASLSRRLKEVRQEVYGEHGGPELARGLGLPARTWYNYETGVTVPAEVLLGFIERTGANPLWLLNGEGPRYRRLHEDRPVAELTPVELIRRGLEKLEHASNEAVVVAPENLPADIASEFVAVPIYPLDAISTSAEPSPALVNGHVLAYRQWLPKPSETIAARLIDDAMHPILPAGSIVAIDRSVTDPLLLNGRLVAACPKETSMVRWLDFHGRHIILKPSHSGGEHPLVLIEFDAERPSVIIGEVVWSWSRFSRD